MTDDSLSDDVPRGYRLAAEWEPHAATWLSWPHNRETWPGAFDPIPGVWTELVRILAAHEPVHILAGGDDVMADATRRVGGLSGVTIHDVATNDAWIRDHGPMFLCAADEVEGRPPAIVDWEYDAWGGKYPPFDLDNGVPRAVAELIGAARYVPRMAGLSVVLEGGAVESNGAGTVLACESCLVGPRRNASLAREDFERLLCDYAGVRKVIWITATGDAVGIAGDDTDGHIDQLARFVAPRRVVVATEDDRGDEDGADENFELLAGLWEQLSAARNADGEPLELVRLPMPRAVTQDPVIHEGVTNGGGCLPASYANFYVANSVVLVPQFDDVADEPALAILAECFPSRDVHGFPSRDLIRGLGGVHCVTLNQRVG